MNYNKFKHAPAKMYFDNFGNLIIENGTMYYYPNLSAKDINGEPATSDSQKDSLRSFKVFIDDPEFANQLHEEGWSVSATKPDEDGNVSHLLKIKVSYRFFEPKIFMHNSMNPAKVTERTKEDVAQMDQDDILNESLNIIVRPSKYKTPAGKEGISAYLKEMHYMFQGNPFDNMYALSLDDGECPDED